MNWLLLFFKIAPQLIVIAEQALGKGQGAAKKAAVIAAGAALVGQEVACVSPKVGQVIDAVVASLNTAGGVPTNGNEPITK